MRSFGPHPQNTKQPSFATKFVEHALRAFLGRSHRTNFNSKTAAAASSQTISAQQQQQQRPHKPYLHSSSSNNVNTMMMIPTFTITNITLSLLAACITWWVGVRVRRRRRPRLPPGPPGWPVLGNLLQLGPLPHRHMAQLCRKYGPLVYLRLGSAGAITTDDPELMRQILNAQDDAFASRPETAAAKHLAYGRDDVALAPLGPKWKHLRRVCMEHLLTARRLDSFSPQRRHEADLLVRAVADAARDAGVVNLRELLGAFAMNNVTRMILGKRFFGNAGAGPAESAEFRHMMQELFHLLGVFHLGDYLPLWRRLDPFRLLERQMSALARRHDAFHSAIIREHRERRETGAAPPADFVDVLLSLSDDLDEHDMKAIMHDIIAAGTDTSAVTTEWAMAEVIANPRVMARAQAELDSVVGRARLAGEADLPRLPYLRCIVRETFRLHPTAPFLVPRESVAPATVSGYHVPAGTLVFINTYALGRNPRVWGSGSGGDPSLDEFWPERHLYGADGQAVESVEIGHGSDFRILPFGSGKRRCPGSPLGTCMVLLALARLVQCFNWRFPGGGGAVSMEEVFGLTLPRAEPLVAVAEPRFPLPLDGSDYADVVSDSIAD